jgi:O-6-methylguanine DNA methyltransferase
MFLACLSIALIRRSAHCCWRRTTPEAYEPWIGPITKSACCGSCDGTMAIHRYFAGDLGAIDKISVETAGTSFQRSVWKELRNIPTGSAISYGQLAEQIARPRAVRAVGLANGSNPIGIVVPCHRVIGADGSLTGYGGGLERKKWLLDHERKHVGKPNVM